MKHRVQLLVAHAKRFSSLTLSDYKDEKGRYVKYEDINGETPGVYKITKTSLEFDYADEYDKKLVDFLRNHPLKNSYHLHDLKVNEEKEVEALLSSADAILVASKMGMVESNDFARLCGIPLDADTDIIKARLIKMASISADKFMELYTHPEKEDIVFIRKALDKGIITKDRGSYKHNRVVMGLTEEATIVWLKENADIYALMKQELRGNVSVEIKPTKKSKVK